VVGRWRTNKQSSYRTKQRIVLTRQSLAGGFGVASSPIVRVLLQTRIGHLRGPAGSSTALVQPSAVVAAPIHLVCAVGCLLTRRVDRAVAARPPAGRQAPAADRWMRKQEHPMSPGVKDWDGPGEKFVNSGNDRFAPCRRLSTQKCDVTARMSESVLEYVVDPISRNELPSIPTNGTHLYDLWGRNELSINQ